MSCTVVRIFCYLCHRPLGTDHCCDPYESCCPDCVDWLDAGRPGFPPIFKNEEAV